MLKVTVAEMDRQVIKQLGVNLSGSVGYGSAVINFNSTNAFPISGTPASSVSGGWKGLTATLQAMEQAGVVRTLAEPTLTAISGESAHFLAGGMFPYPSVTSCTTTPCPPTIQFQTYGVGLNFTPVVLSEGRISIHVATEVSQLDPQNSVTVAGTTVPGLTVRRADTTAEVSSGSTLAMAGMLEDQTKQDITGLPGLMEVPILGTLFKSRDYLNNKTELVVLVTPYIQRTVPQKELSRPDDGFADPSDPASVLLGRLNRIYGVTASPPNTTYYGKIGFILD
jgi:pilus assembly protein CpaC